LLQRSFRTSFYFAAVQATLEACRPEESTKKAAEPPPVGPNQSQAWRRARLEALSTAHLPKQGQEGSGSGIAPGIGGPLLPLEERAG